MSTGVIEWVVNMMVYTICNNIYITYVIVRVNGLKREDREIREVGFRDCEVISNIADIYYNVMILIYIYVYIYVLIYMGLC